MDDIAWRDRDSAIEPDTDFSELPRALGIPSFEDVGRGGRRRALTGMDSFDEYLVRIESNRNALATFPDPRLINVTAFHRDPLAWSALSARLPSVIGGGKDSAVRVWSAGCSWGEDTYTLAILLAELLGPQSFARRVKIYATDIDDEALFGVRRAVYPRRAVETLDPTLVARYFTRAGDDLVVRDELRRAVVVGRHDVVHSAPICHIDLLACPRTLMQIDERAETRMVQRFARALNPNGLLFFGSVETLFSRSDLSSRIETGRRLFTPGAVTNEEGQTMSEPLRRARATGSRPREPSRGLAKASPRSPPSEARGREDALETNDSSAVGNVEEVR